MTVESATNVAQLNTSYPAESDSRREGAQQMRLIKTALKNLIKTIDGTDITVMSSGLYNSIIPLLFPVGIVVVLNDPAGTEVGPHPLFGGTWICVKRQWDTGYANDDYQFLSFFMRTA